MLKNIQLQWFQTTWREFPIEILRNLLEESRFTAELDINIDVALDMI